MGFREWEESTQFGSPLDFYKFEMGSTIWRFIGADTPMAIHDIPIGDSPYVFGGPITRTAADMSQEDTAGAIVVTVDRANAIAQLGIAYAPPTKVAVTIFQIHRADFDPFLDNDPEQSVVFAGEVSGWSFEGSQVRLTCVPSSQALGRLIPVLRYQSQCNWALFGTGCGLSAAAFKVTAVLDAVAGVTLTDSQFATKPDGWFINGWVQRSTGERRFIVDHVGSVVTLMNPFPADLVAGESVDAFAGCDRTEAVCAAKFANLVNHMGWARIPSRNPHGGGAIA
jgi:uncharacterized phage protein (TIGR02218 family)